MSKTLVQSGRAETRTRDETASPSTREAILAAAAELVAELGWGGVTTRAVAERAGVLNGVVSYHFNSKAELLRQAAISGIEHALAEPTTVLVAAPNVAAGIEAFVDWLDTSGPSASEISLMTETMLACQRDEQLRSFVAANLDEYRSLLAELLDRDVRAAGGRCTAGVREANRGIAALIVAVVDGLILHTLAAPDFEPRHALETLASLIEPARLAGRARRRRPANGTKR